MKLASYKNKRNLKKSGEPKGKVTTTDTHDLYVIQKHAATHLHYDFRLELGGVLLSWAIPKGPSLDPQVKRLAIQTEDHPVEYGSFEGVIPKGQYGGGTVMLWDTGTWLCDDANPTAAYQKGHLHLTLKGKKLKGHWNLIKLKNQDDRSWFLIKSDDQYAKSSDSFDVTLKHPKSVFSKLTIDQIAKKHHKILREGVAEDFKNLFPANKKIKKATLPKIELSTKIKKSNFPSKISPQLATLVDQAPAGDDWLHEIKFDGYRMLAFVDGDSVKLLSRNHHDWTDHFDNIASHLANLGLSKTILDGEVVLLDNDQKSNFQLLQNSIDDNAKHPFIYYIFDILFYDGHDLKSLPLIERKALLHQFITSTTAPVLRYSDHVIGHGAELFEKSCKLGLEGIISKKIDGRYLEKRGKNWLKVKCVKRQELVIGGYTKPQGSRRYFGSLFLGYYNEKKEFIYCGNVGTGFNATSLKSIHRLLEANRTNQCPFAVNPPGYTTAVWVQPKLVVEVEFTEWTSEGSLRHPSFKGLRIDKKPREITKEKSIPNAKPKNSHFQLTHPDKIVYAEDKISKLDLAEYYETVQDWILPFISNRPLSLVRCPHDYHECFYQKHLNKPTSKVLHTMDIQFKESKEECIYINNFAGLIALVQMGVLEIHPWGSTINKIEYPDIMTFDLDPAPEVPWKKVVESALLIRDYLNDYKLKSYVKTTGGKGLHVVVPIAPKYHWDEVKVFSRTLVEFIVANHPDQYVSQMSKLKRKDKIFLDYLRNQRGATAVAAYSTRARIHAPVSTPLDWDELTNNMEDTTFNIITLPDRLNELKKDPWADFFKMKQSLRLDKLAK